MAETSIELLAHEMADIKDKIASHNEVHESHMFDLKKDIHTITTSINDIKLKMADVYTRDQADERFASKDTEKWLKAGIGVIVFAFIAALIVLVWPSEARAMYASLNNFF